MQQRSRFIANVSRRAVTIQGQIRGIDRLFEKRDVPQVLTQSSAVRSALDSLVKVLLEAAVVDRFAVESLGERPEDAFERALERAMTHWFAASDGARERSQIPDDEHEFWTAAREHVRAIENRLRDIGLVLEGHDYLRGLEELGAMRREIDELTNDALRKFIRDRTAGTAGSKKAKDAFERAVADALKYWHLPDPRVAAVAPSDSSRKVLVVDDDPDVTDYVKRILEKHSFAVLAAADATQAMSAVEAERPDLIILDVMMPTGTEGFHFTWQLRARPEAELRNIPIIVLTAIHDTTSLRFYPDQSDNVYAPGEYLPVEAFIDKPVDEEKLLQNVNRVLASAARNANNTA